MDTVPYESLEGEVEESPAPVLDPLLPNPTSATTSDDTGTQAQPHSASPNSVNTHFFWWSGRTMIFIFIGIFLLLAVKWILFYFYSKHLVALLTWFLTHLTRHELATLIFAALALFPVAFMETQPFMWVAGMAFGFELGFPLIITGIAVGVTLPYFFCFPLRPTFQNWLENDPADASFLELVRRLVHADWITQSLAIALLRMSPLPYRIFNYVAIFTTVDYGPYLFGSSIGMLIDIFSAIGSGISFRYLTDGTDKNSIFSFLLQIGSDLLWLGMSLLATLVIGRRLQLIEEEEDEPLEVEGGHATSRRRIMRRMSI